MIIEEHELHYPPSSPLRAWRLFRVRALSGAVALSSPMYHDPDPPPWPNVASVASCYQDHPAPAPGCRCGIYAAVPGTFDSLPGYLLDTARDHDPWAYAEIACSGRVFVDMRGIRAARAALVRIALPDSCWPDQAALDAAKRMLHERYGVPVRGLDDVPDWVTGNQRGAGPPPDEMNPHLDVNRLNLGSRPCNPMSCSCTLRASPEWDDPLETNDPPPTARGVSKIMGSTSSDTASPT